MQETFENKVQSINEYLKDLNAKCSNIEKQIIVSETNLERYTKEAEDLKQEIEANTGISINEVPEMLEEKRHNLANVYNRLVKINLDDLSSIDINTLNEINDLITQLQS